MDYNIKHYNIYVENTHKPKSKNKNEKQKKSKDIQAKPLGQCSGTAKTSVCCRGKVGGQIGCRPGRSSRRGMTESL